MSGICVACKLGWGWEWAKRSGVRVCLYDRLKPGFIHLDRGSVMVMSSKEASRNHENQEKGVSGENKHDFICSWG